MTQSTSRKLSTKGESRKNGAVPPVEDLHTLSGFSAAICYLSFEAYRAGWIEAHRLLEKAHSALMDEIGAAYSLSRRSLNSNCMASENRGRGSMKRPLKSERRTREI